MKRRKPLKRTRIQRKARKNDRPDLRYEWRQEHLSCSCCWAREGRFGVSLHVHHILSGKYGRQDHYANFLRLCSVCHSLVHGGRVRGEGGSFLPEISLGMQLTLKMESDSENYDPIWMKTVMAPRPLPEPEPLPEALKNLRHTH